MKHRILAMLVMVLTVLSVFTGVLVKAEPNVKYEYITAEDVIEAVAKENLYLTNSIGVDGSSKIGMTESYVYDDVKGKEVRSFNFKAKEEGANKAGSSEVRATLDGFAKFMTDANVNTISFDYKITGTSDGHIGLFLVNGAEDYGEQVDPCILIGNKSNINIQWKINQNTGGSDWYSYAKNYYEHTIEATSDNRDWNKITIEINKETGDVTGYLNNELFSFDPIPNNNAANSPEDMDSIAFQTAGVVAADGDLAILIDNIKVYPGKRKFNTNISEGTWKFETGLQLDGFGFADKDGNYVTSIQSENYVKTTLSNETDSSMSVIVLVTGYKNGILKSVDLKRVDIKGKDKFEINQETNAMFLDEASEYDRIQLSLLDGKERYPILSSVELFKE